MLEEYLTTLVRLYKQNGQTQQSLAGFILEHGRFFGADAKSFKGRRMTPKECFCNATKVVLRDPSMTYVEGYVMTIIPIHHAWCMRPDGKVFDPTLRLVTATASAGPPDVRHPVLA